MNQVKLNVGNFFFKDKHLLLILLCFWPISLFAQNNVSIKKSAQENIITGAEQSEKYLPLLANKKVAVVTNQTGIVTYKYIYNGALDPSKECARSFKIDTLSIVDFLLNKNIAIEKIFSPEHGFKGDADAGEQVKDGKDVKTNIDIVSLYGNNKKPTKEQLENIDIILFDIQDVGVRFYTYLSTLHYLMEAAAENNIQVIVLDRPNPNANYIDGPVLKEGFQSFVGMHPVPVVYGMTIGEYAQMINGEKWLNKGVACDLTVIPLQNYAHNTFYSLPVVPSPNLKTDHAINLYPSLCFFEGTNVSEGRGTIVPFEIYGSPYLKNQEYQFTPKSVDGAKNPKYKDLVCYGEDLTNEPFLSQINLHWLLSAYTNNTKEPFFNKDLFFDKLAGTDELRKQIIAGKSEQEIKKSWEKDLDAFKIVRKKYLLYP